MKHITILTSVASLSFAAFIAAIALGSVSMPLFIASSVSWLILLSVHAYTPRRSWLPRRAIAAIPVSERRKAALPLAA